MPEDKPGAKPSTPPTPKEPPPKEPLKESWENTPPDQKVVKKGLPS